MNRRNAAIEGLIYCSARVMLAAPFLFSGVTKALDPAAAMAEFAGLGLPEPALLVLAVIAFQLTTGTLMTFGLWVTPVALALAGFTFLATIAGHPFWRADGAALIHDATTALEHLGLIGGLLALVILERTAGRGHNATSP
ncbi:MAG: DoxX family protein [Pseudomonadota bacterium]